MKVKLCGGSNDGRVITVLHGASVKVKRRDVANGFDVNGEVIASPQLFETYRRPAKPLITGDTEHWNAE